MRIVLIHNPSAGDGHPSQDELEAIFRRARIEAVYQSVAEDDWQRILRGDERFDAAVVAGGDGTIRKVVHELYGRTTPVAIVPLGTANNMASTIGAISDAVHVTEALRQGARHSVNLGRVQGLDSEDLFIEGLGVGLLADTMQAVDRIKHEGEHPVQDEKRAALEMLLLVLEDSSPVDFQINLDGRDHSGSYLLVQVMNIGCAGSNVLLAPAADPCDGFLDVVVARESDRKAIAEYVQARLEGSKAELRLPVHRARNVVMGWSGSTLHVDDQLWPKKGQCPPAMMLKIEVDPQTIDFLVAPTTASVAASGH